MLFLTPVLPLGFKRLGYLVCQTAVATRPRFSSSASGGGNKGDGSDRNGNGSGDKRVEGRFRSPNPFTITSSTTKSEPISKRAQKLLARQLVAANKSSTKLPAIRIKHSATELTHAHSNYLSGGDKSMKEQYALVQALRFQLAEEEAKIKPISEYNIPLTELTPKLIRQKLDDHVVGQDELKKTISVAIFNHYCRVKLLDDILATGESVDFLPVEKSNVLLVGPTGSGKTLLAKTAASILNVPFSMNDATPMTQAGYVGEDVEACLKRLLHNSNYDVVSAERGIIFIDEIDKIGKRQSATPGTRDVSGEGVQQSLLRILEGTSVTLSVKVTRDSKTTMEEYVLNTGSILFVCSGAFVGLDQIMAKRSGIQSSIGFNQHVANVPPSDNILPEQMIANAMAVEPEDIVDFGFIPEFVGRFPVLASSNPLGVKELVSILSEPKNNLVEQYKKLFSQINIDLTFSSEALEAIALQAKAKNTGARGLRRIMEDVLRDALYEYPGTEVNRLRVVADRTILRVIPESL